jgi:3-oxoacyl-[acyl-carrier-protein] synthase III
MRWESTYLAGLGRWLPPAAPVRDAVDAGLVDAERFKTLGYLSVCVADDTAPPDMAVAAGRQALARADVDPRDLAVAVHGSLWFQGLDIWPAGSYVAAALDARGVPAFDVQQRCNIGLGGIELCAAYPATARAYAALLTTADRFAAPAVDRWNAHEFNMYGDGGTALVLSRRGGFARLRSTATVADNALEGQARGDEPLRACSPAALAPIDLQARAQAYASGHDPVQLSTRIGRVMLLARNRALADAGVALADVARVVTPASGRLRGDHQVHHLLGVSEEQTTWEYGRRTGHVGAGDWVLGLEHLLTGNELRAGDLVLLFGGGAGYTCTAAVVEILRVPAWS